MSRAAVAILKSQIEGVAARHLLTHDEMVRALLDMAVFHAPRAGIDGKMLHALVDDLRAQLAVERGEPAHEQ